MNETQRTAAEESASNIGWRQALDQAVTAVDEPAILRVMADQFGNEEAHNELATLVSRMAYSTNTRPVFCELFMVPVVEQGNCTVIAERNAWKSASGVVRETIRGWFADRDRTIVFDGINPLDWVGQWSPRILRDHLQRVIPGSQVQTTTFTSSKIGLPAHAPRLGFVCVVRVSMNGWPSLPAANAQRDNRFREIVRRSLQVASPMDGNSPTVPPAVLTPERVQFAITDGVNLWLTSLHEAIGVLGWTVTPIKTNPDAMQITLSLDSDEVPMTSFLLRLHQIGMQGVHDVITLLSTLAPCSEKPQDSVAH